MEKKFATIFLLFSALVLQGCNSFKENSASETNTVADELAPSEQQVSGEEAQPSQDIADEDIQTNHRPRLQQCLKNMDALVNLNEKKYRADYNELYSLINNAKYYASIYNATSENVKLTVTPLFEYKVNYKCNKISQSLIDEFNTIVQKPKMLGDKES